MARSNDKRGHAMPRGRSIEDEFSELISRLKGGKPVYTSSMLDDMHDHWDVMCDGLKYDVKSMRSVGHTTGKANYHWIEYVNVLGHPGWLFGKADFIAFEISHEEFLIVQRKLLISELAKVVDLDSDKSKEYFSPWTRHSRQDVVVKVPIDWLSPLGRRFLKNASIGTNANKWTKTGV